MAWSSEQLANARVIAQVGRSMGASERDILIALMTAMQESGLRNLNYGDRDSLGLFQQRPSQGWGSASQVRDPQYASRKFYENLLRINGRDSMSLTQAAQKVQRSAFPNAYAKHEGSMRQLMQELGVGGGAAFSGPGATPDILAQAGQPLGVQAPGAAVVKGPHSATPQGAASAVTDPLSMAPDAVGTAAPAPLGIESADNPLPIQLPDQNESVFQVGKNSKVLSRDDYYSIASGGAKGKGAELVAIATRYQGTPYVWGGSSPLGFDCSGFTQFVFRQLGINLPRVSYQQGQGGQAVGLDELQPGDLIFYDTGSRNPGADHVAIYMGNGMQIEANNPGGKVTVGKLRTNGAWARRYL